MIRIVEMRLEQSLYEQVFNTVPLGLMIIGQDYCIHAWNNWLATNSKIDAKKALGKPLTAVCKEPLSPRFNWAIDQVLKYGHPQTLSSILNKFVVPIPLSKGAFGKLDKMQQDIQILPINHDNQAMALVIIKDVSDKIHLKNTLMTIAAKFEKNSLIDMLTGCYNRRFLFKYLEAELSTAKRKAYNVVCCIYDLDHFKRINDEFGHNAGDAILISFTKLAMANLRPSDYFFRYGGEEFISISKQISLNNAPIIPNRIRHHLENTKQYGSINKKITCSGGISYWTPADPPLSAEQLVKLADIQLYKAKTEGRNCIIMDGQLV